MGYVLFDKLDNYAETNVVYNAQDYLQSKIDDGTLVVPKGVSYKLPVIMSSKFEPITS
ncbi:MAG: hypothetical protein R2728_08215 [Chitinophagales bacterium]